METRTQSRTGERSLSELLSEMSGEVSTLVRKEIELAKVETKEQVRHATKAGVMLGASGVGGFVALLLLAMAAAWGLAEIFPAGLAFLVVGMLFLLVAGLLVSVGRRQLSAVRPMPEQTIAAIRQDVATAKTSLSRGAAGTRHSSDWVGQRA